jgi:hypothetical protein
LIGPGPRNTDRATTGRRRPRADHLVWCANHGLREEEQAAARAFLAEWHAEWEWVHSRAERARLTALHADMVRAGQSVPPLEVWLRQHAWLHEATE